MTGPVRGSDASAHGHEPAARRTDAVPERGGTWWQPWVERWDAVMRGYVPWREQAHTTALDVLEEQGALDRVVDLGCGAGTFTRAVLDADLLAPQWPAALEGPVDAVVACDVVHVVEAADHLAVVTTIASALRPGGLFIDVDEVPLPPSTGALAVTVARIRQHHVEAHVAEGHEDFRAWMEDLRGQPEVGPLVPLQAQRLTARRQGRVADRDERLHALRRAGFTDVAEVQRRLDTAVLVAVRP